MATGDPWFLRIKQKYFRKFSFASVVIPRVHGVPPVSFFVQSISIQYFQVAQALKVANNFNAIKPSSVTNKNWQHSFKMEAAAHSLKGQKGHVSCRSPHITRDQNASLGQKCRQSGHQHVSEPCSQDALGHILGSSAQQIATCSDFERLQDWQLITLPHQFMVSNNIWKLFVWFFFIFTKSL